MTLAYPSVRWASVATVNMSMSIARTTGPEKARGDRP